MVIDKNKLLIALKNIDFISNTKKRESNMLYKDNLIFYWNSELWCFLKSQCNNNRSTINRNDFYTFCRPSFNYSEFSKLFNFITVNNTYEFSSVDFEEFLCKIDEYDYNNILNAFNETPPLYCPVNTIIEEKETAKESTNENPINKKHETQTPTSTRAIITNKRRIKFIDQIKSFIKNFFSKLL